jgi:NAD(P)-dependent dehydrogenase (short-subunit alcohol dehydrogenase family)
MQRVRDKVVLITGGSSGIGRATALRLAGCGNHVAIAARQIDRLDEVAAAARAAGSEILTLPTDVTDSDQCRHAAETTVDHFGRLDILVCSAGISMRCHFDGARLDAMERVMRVNFFGTLYATHAALPHIKKTRGSLVAISSLTGKFGIPSYSIYGASKFAVQGLYEALRLELRRDGVHVGVVSPGFVDTPLRQQVLGPDGEVWASPPAPPFRVWPVEKCVDHVLRLIARRKAEMLLPWYIGPLLTLDRLVGGWLSDLVLSRRFPREVEQDDKKSTKCLFGKG